MFNKSIKFAFILSTCIYLSGKTLFLTIKSLQQLLKMIDIICKDFDNGSIVSCLYLDFSKAFDTESFM